MLPRGQPSPLEPTGQGGDDAIVKARTAWLKNSEVADLLEHQAAYGLSICSSAPFKPEGGTLWLINRREVRFFRKDGWEWEKKADGKSLKETHEKLKIGKEDVLNCYYCHAEGGTGLQRRIYWLLDETQDHIVLVHYLVGSGKTSGPEVMRSRAASGELAARRSSRGGGGGRKKQSGAAGGGAGGAGAAAAAARPSRRGMGGSESGTDPAAAGLPSTASRLGLLGLEDGGERPSTELSGLGGSSVLLGVPVAEGGGATLPASLPLSLDSGLAPSDSQQPSWQLLFRTYSTQRQQQQQQAEQQLQQQVDPQPRRPRRQQSVGRKEGRPGRRQPRGLGEHGGEAEQVQQDELLFSEISLGLSRLPNLDTSMVSDILEELSLLGAGGGGGGAVGGVGPSLTHTTGGISSFIKQLLEGQLPGGGAAAGGPAAAEGGGGAAAAPAAAAEDGCGGGAAAAAAGPSLQRSETSSWLKQLQEGVLSGLATHSLPAWQPDLDIPPLELMLENEGAAAGAAGPRETRAAARAKQAQQAQQGQAAGPQVAVQQRQQLDPQQQQALRSEVLRYFTRILSTGRQPAPTSLPTLAQPQHPSPPGEEGAESAEQRPHHRRNHHRPQQQQQQLEVAEGSGEAADAGGSDLGIGLLPHHPAQPSRRAWLRSESRVGGSDEVGAAAAAAAGLYKPPSLPLHAGVKRKASLDRPESGGSHKAARHRAAAGGGGTAKHAPALRWSGSSKG